MKFFIEICAIILIVGVAISKGELMKCEYVTYDEDGYNCRLITKFDEPTEVTSVSSNHMYSKTADNVETIYVPSAINTSYIPTKICSFFKNLKKIDLYSKTLKEFNKQIFEGCDKLETIHVRYINMITTLDDGIFDNLPNLKDVYFHQTSLESLSKNLFKKNPAIEKINFNTNRLKVIEFQLEPEQKSNIKKFSFLDNACIKIAFDQDDYRSNTLQKVIDTISENCQNNSTPTPAPPPETADEQRLFLLENKIDVLDEFKKSLEDQIQMQSSNVNSSVFLNSLKFEVLKTEVKNMTDLFNTKINTDIINVGKNYESLNARTAKIDEKVKELEVKINENSKIKESNKELEAEISHNKNILIAIVCVQVLTVGFAVFITFYFKLFSRLGGSSNNV